MRTKTFLKKAVAGLGSAAFAIVLSACAHHNATTDQYGQIRTEAPATTADNGQTVGTAPAPDNAVGVASTSTPSVISGPAAVDKSGRAYTSSATGGSGNSATLGTNTDVNLIPKKSSSNVMVTESAATAEMPAMTPAPVVAETPAPAPIITETPAPASTPVVETPTPAPMSSSTETTETPVKHHRRLHKD